MRQYVCWRPNRPRKLFGFGMGNLLSPSEELQLLDEHFKAIFQTEQKGTPQYATSPLILAIDELERQLNEIKEKAVAPNSMPALLVKKTAGSLARWLHTFLSPELRGLRFLRPIALTGPIGKALLGGKAKEAMMPVLVTLPKCSGGPGHGFPLLCAHPASMRQVYITRRCHPLA